MAKRHYLKEWRKKRRLTQEQVTDRLAVFDDKYLPKTAASLSRIERGQQVYNERIIEALAKIYDVEPADLIGRNPEKEGRVYDLMARLNPPELEQAEAVITALTKVAESRAGYIAPAPAPPTLKPRRKH